MAKRRHNVHAPEIHGVDVGAHDRLGMLVVLAQIVANHRFLQPLIRQQPFGHILDGTADQIVLLKKLHTFFRLPIEHIDAGFHHLLALLAFLQLLRQIEHFTVDRTAQRIDTLIRARMRQPQMRRRQAVFAHIAGIVIAGRRLVQRLTQRRLRVRIHVQILAPFHHAFQHRHQAFQAANPHRLLFHRLDAELQSLPALSDFRQMIHQTL